MKRLAGSWVRWKRRGRGKTRYSYFRVTTADRNQDESRTTESSAAEKAVSTKEGFAFARRPPGTGIYRLARRIRSRCTWLIGGRRWRNCAVRHKLAICRWMAGISGRH